MPRVGDEHEFVCEHVQCFTCSLSGTRSKYEVSRTVSESLCWRVTDDDEFQQQSFQSLARCRGEWRQPVVAVVRADSDANGGGRPTDTAHEIPFGAAQVRHRAMGGLAQSERSGRRLHATRRAAFE